ncbi:AAA family ATPase [Onishia taeanensis]
MIAGVFLRNYKCYKNINFIPLVYSGDEVFNVFVGSNGVGKSSILESLDVLMNEVDPRYWSTTQGQKKDRTNIFPVFLIKKEEFSPNSQEVAISEAFWNLDFLSHANSDIVKSFVAWRDDIEGRFDKDEYLLFAIGKDYSGNTLLTTTFHEKVFNHTRRHGVSKLHISNLLGKIIERYSYVYIPVENKIGDVLSHQAKEMQSLMDKSVVDEIKVLLDRREHVIPDSGRSKKSIVDLVNYKLDSYMEEINRRMPDGYKFEPKGTNKKTVKSNDILKTVLSSYFNIRPLTKDDKHIGSLSSGEQRLALIDVATTLLSTETSKSKEVILAIDEPESSLEAANQFEQFSRLVELSEKFGRQVLVTTHWYGLLLRPTQGRLNFVCGTSSSPDVAGYPLINLHDYRRSFPDSVEMKSYFDLMGSMLSLLKKSDYKWLVCEGHEDARYLSLYLDDFLDDVIVLPLNGCGNLKKLFDFLSVPFSDKEENKQIQGKVFFLSDTDEKNVLTIGGYGAGLYKGKMEFNRLYLNRDKDEVRLISVADPTGTNTVIEDVLDGDVMWDAFQEIAKRDSVFSDLIEGFDKKSGVNYSEVTKGLGFLKKNTYESYEKSDCLRRHIMSSDFKKILCDQYCKSYRRLGSPKTLNWVDEIKRFFIKE